MTEIVMTEEAESSVRAALKTPDFTDKRRHLQEALFALRPHSNARPTAENFSARIDRLLTKRPDELPAAVLEAARDFWN